MFGSVDNPDDYTSLLEKHNVAYKLHIDGAYGGFVYPFSNKDSVINFSNPKISSITIDAHKMLQAPYGTGVFICRKGLIENVEEYKFKLLNKENEFNLIKLDNENNKKIINELTESESKLKAENISTKTLFIKEIRTLKFDLDNTIKQRDQLKNFMTDFKKQVNLYKNLKINK